MISNNVKWRDAASLIMLSKKTFEVLLVKRHEKSPSYPSDWVFPGGTSDSADKSPLWLKYIHNAEIEKKNTATIRPSNSKTDISADNIALNNELSLKITALRETFEEVGVLLCRHATDFKIPVVYSHMMDGFDCFHWQETVRSDPMNFLKMCKELQIIPDIWSLHHWSMWLTPSTFKKRFKTSFYVTILENTTDISISIDTKELMRFAWDTPQRYLRSYEKGDIWMPSPQFYEISRFSNGTTLENLIFPRTYKENPILMLPIICKCIDGTVSLLPGDDSYPSDNINAEIVKTNLTIKDYRMKAKKLHRLETKHLGKSVLFVNIDINTPLTGKL